MVKAVCFLTVGTPQILSITRINIILVSAIDYKYDMI